MKFFNIHLSFAYRVIVFVLHVSDKVSCVYHAILVSLSAGKMQKKGSLLFDYACHPCTGTMLIFSVYLSVLLMPPSRSPGPFANAKINIHKQHIFLVLYTTQHSTPNVWHTTCENQFIFQLILTLVTNKMHINDMLSIDTCDSYGLTTSFAFRKLSHADFASEIILYIMLMQGIRHPFDVTCYSPQCL